MTAKQTNSSAKFTNLPNISLFDKLAKEYLLMNGKRFKLKYVNSIDEPFQKKVIYDTSSEKEYNCTMAHQEDLCDLLNELHREKEDLKNSYLTVFGENEILWNELFIMMGNGVEPTDAFKEYREHQKMKISKRNES